MSHTPIVSLPSIVNIKRRALPLASAAAALSLAGCGLLGGGHPKAPLADGNTAADSAPQRTAEQVRAMTAGLDAAIAKLDDEKIRAITERRAPVRSQPATQAVTPVDTQPAAEGAGGVPANLQLPTIGAGPMVSATSVLGNPGGILGIDSGSDTMKGMLRDAGDAAGSFDFASLTAPMAPAEAPAPTLESALEVLRARVAARPSLNTVLALALLEKSEGHAIDAAAAKDLSATDQKLLQDLLGAMDGLSLPTKGAVTLHDRAVPLLEAAKKWQADADLVLPRLALASRVDSFGVYTKVDPKFTAGRKTAVIIYCEVANFLPKQTEDGWYETRLSQQETLATEDGYLLWRPNPEDVVDRSKNQRHDFYLVKKLTIPENLAVGKYALRMSVTDKNSGKIAVVTLPIEIVQ